MLKNEIQAIKPMEEVTRMTTKWSITMCKYVGWITPYKFTRGGKTFVLHKLFIKY